MSRLPIVCLLLLGAACSEPASPAPEVDLDAHQRPPAPPPPGPMRTIDDISADLARGPIPGFAGTMRVQGQRVVMMTEAGELETVRTYVDPDGDRPFADVERVVRVRYDFAQLYDWKWAMVRSPAFQFVLSADINERNNRVELGAWRQEVDDVLAAAHALGIPADAISVQRDDMMLTGTISQVRTETSFMLVDAVSETMGPLDTVRVNHAPDMAVPPVGSCVEIQAMATLLMSAPPQAGARQLRVIDC